MISGIATTPCSGTMPEHGVGASADGNGAALHASRWSIEGERQGPRIAALAFRALPRSSPGAHRATSAAMRGLRRGGGPARPSIHTHADVERERERERERTVQRHGAGARRHGSPACDSIPPSRRRRESPPETPPPPPRPAPPRRAGGAARGCESGAARGVGQGPPCG